MKEQFFALAIYTLFQCLRFTYRIKLVGEDVYSSLKEQNSSLIYAAPHGRMLGLIAFTMGRPISMLASLSKDGQIITGVLRLLGFKVVSGSSSRGGIRSLIQLLKHADNGRELAITVDGPKGPPFVVKPGIIALASKAQIPILPITYTCQRPFIFKRAWDSFMLPLPFSTLTISYGNPVEIPSEIGKEDISKYCDELGSCLKAETSKLDLNHRVK